MKRSCPKIGIKIRESNNTHNHNIQEGQNKFRNPTLSNTSTCFKSDIRNKLDIDLNLENYSCDDLFALFGIQDKQLDEDLMKSVKRIVLKTHPDKSPNLSNDYFIFFSLAYNRLLSIYKFQNKLSKNAHNTSTEYSNYMSDENSIDNSELLDNFFDSNAKFKKSTHFNKWFNAKFDKHRIKEEDYGYEEWMKSDEGLIFTGSVTPSEMSEKMEMHKQQLKSIVKYEDIKECYSSSFIGDDNKYSDLKQSYSETILPVSQSDYDSKQQFGSLNEYKMFRDKKQQKVKCLNEKQSLEYIQKKNNELNNQCIQTGFEYAQRLDKQANQNNLFWSDLKLIK